MKDIEEIKNKETPTKYVTRVAMDKAIFSTNQLLKTTERLSQSFAEIRLYVSEIRFF